MKYLHIQDCIPCVLRKTLVFDMICHFPSLTCRHVTNGSKPGLKPSKFKEVLSIFNVVFLFGTLYITVEDILSEKQISTATFYQSLLDLIILSLSLSTAVIFHYEKSKNLIHLNYFIQLIEKRKLYGMNSVLSATFSTYLVKVNVLVFYLNTSYLFGRTLFKVSFNHSTFKTIFYHIGIALAYSNLGNMGAYILNLLVLYWYIMRKSLNEVRKILEQTGEDEERIVSWNYEQHMVSFANLIFYIIIFLGMSSLGVVWCLFLSAVRFGNKDDLGMLADLSCRHYLFLLIFLIFCECTERILTLSEDLISFLFKYPISKLTQLEAAQVETLITTLTLKRPELRASDIFTVGTNLFSSIFGTVVTYVLVALQFYASFSKS